MKKAEAITLPDILGAQSGRVTKWYVQEGDQVKEGQVLAELDMGAAVMELESYQAGTILHIGAKTNQEIEVGYLLAIIGEEGAEIGSIMRKTAADFLDRENDKATMKGYLGEVRLFAGRTLPSNWMLCDGKELLVEEFEDLFEVLGTKYGGDGYRLFKLPEIPALNNVEYIICVEGDFPA